jgi:hypothetical protein
MANQLDSQMEKDRQTARAEKRQPTKDRESQKNQEGKREPKCPCEAAGPVGMQGWPDRILEAIRTPPLHLQVSTGPGYAPTSQVQCHSEGVAKPTSVISPGSARTLRDPGAST